MKRLLWALLFLPFAAMAADPPTAPSAVSPGNGTVTYCWNGTTIIACADLPKIIPQVVNFTGTTGVSHAVGNIICTAASPCTPLTIPVARSISGTGLIVGVRVQTNFVTSPANAVPRVIFFNAAPTLTGITDNTSYKPAWADRGKVLGYAECLAASQTISSDMVDIVCTFPASAQSVPFTSDNTGNIYAVVIQSPAAGQAYTTTTGQLWYITVTASAN